MDGVRNLPAFQRLAVVLGPVITVVSAWLPASVVARQPALQARHAAPQAVFCAFRQLTDSTGGGGLTSAAISANGARVAFVSDRDLLGDSSNADRNGEIFLVDVATGVLTQITHTVGGVTADPQISGDGTRVAFVSDRDLLGDGSNADGQFEIFLFDTTTATLSQLTDSPSANWQPALSADGMRVAFAGGPALQLFLLDIATGAVTQLTELPFSIGTPVINADGTRIAFVSDDGSGTDEVFLFDTGTDTLSQITDSRHSTVVSISADGTRLVLFSQSRDPLAGGDSSEFGPGYFLLDLATGTLAELSVQSPLSVNADARRIAFSATADLLADGSNADGNTEIFLLDTASGDLAQLTRTVGGTNVVPGQGMNADGTRLAFTSDLDLVADGTNADGNTELFVALCISGRDVDGIREALTALSGDAFAAPGHRTAMLAQLEAIRRDIAGGNFTRALSRLETLRRHVDGCEDGPPADADDWITACDAQQEIRTMIDALVSALGAFL
jgi:Tol biopolymer transport system component